MDQEEKKKLAEAMVSPLKIRMNYSTWGKVLLDSFGQEVEYTEEDLKIIEESKKRYNEMKAKFPEYEPGLSEHDPKRWNYSFGVLTRKW